MEGSIIHFLRKTPLTSKNVGNRKYYLVYDGDNTFLLYTHIVKKERDGFIIATFGKEESVSGYTGSDDFNSFI